MWGKEDTGSAYSTLLGVIPAGTPWNDGDTPTRGVIIISPANVEHESVPVETEDEEQPT